MYVHGCHEDKTAETAIDPDITCTSIGKGQTNDHEQDEVFKVTVKGPVDNPDVVPDYYIAYSVNRFAIKAIRGSITDREAKDMAIDFDTHNFKDLQVSLAR